MARWSAGGMSLFATVLGMLRRSDLIGPGRLVLVVGPSGAGKDTLIAGARAACRDDATVVFPRRVVTRPASNFEDNDFVSKSAFEQAAVNGGLHSGGVRTAMTMEFLWRSILISNRTYGRVQRVADDGRRGPQALRSYDDEPCDGAKGRSRRASGGAGPCKRWSNPGAPEPKCGRAVPAGCGHQQCRSPTAACASSWIPSMPTASLPADMPPATNADN